MKVYIKQNNGNFPDDWLFAAYLGANKLGMEIIFFEDINEVPKSQFVISWIDDTFSYLNRNKKTIPKPLNIPEELKSFIYRDIFELPLKEVYNLDNFPLFIKPADIVKGFPSGVINNKSSLPVVFSDVENKEQLALISTVINIESEYRCFIYKNELVGLKHYQGSFSLFPNINEIKKMIHKFNSSLIAYTIDVGIDDQNKTVLIECQDMWSIGSYGLEEKLYIKMLRDRWSQLMK